MLKPIKDLPAAVQYHIDAHNNHDPELFMSTFAEGALANDVQREFHGAEAIRAWADKEIFGDNVTLEVQEAFDLNGDIIVRSKVDGTYDKSKVPDPLFLTHYFTLRDGKINLLLISNNKANAG